MRIERVTRLLRLIVNDAACIELQICALLGGKMRRATGWVLIAIGCASAICGVVIAARSSDRTQAILALATLAGLAAALVPLGLSMARRQPDKSSELEDWAEQLRDAIRAECRADLQSLQGPRGLISLELAPTTGLNNAIDERASLLTGPTEIANFITTTGQRVLVTGEPGSGKTVLLRRVQQQLVKLDVYPRTVPVMITLADWELSTTSESFDSWVARIVQRKYLNIDAAVVHRLLRAGRVVLLLDALDEAVSSQEHIDDRRMAALNVLNSVTNRPMVVACQAQALERLRLRHAVLHDAPAVELLPVKPKELEATLSGAAIDVAATNDLTNAISDWPDGCLAQLMRRPLFLRIAAGISLDYSIATRLRDFALRPDTSENRYAAESELLGFYLGQVREKRYKQLGDLHARRWLKKPPRRPAYYTESTLHRAYSAIAHYLDHYGGTVVSGERVPNASFIPHYLWVLPGRRRTSAMAALMTTLIWAPLILLLIGDTARASDHIRSFVVVLLLAIFGLASSMVITLGPVRPLYIATRNVTTLEGLRAQGARRLLLGGAVSAWTTITTSVIYGSVVAIAFGSGLFLAFALGLATAVRPDVSERTMGFTGTVIGPALMLATVGPLAGGSPVVAFSCGAGSGAVALVIADVAATIVWKRSSRPSLAFHRVRVPDPHFRLRGDLQAALVITGITLAVAFPAASHTPLFGLTPLAAFWLSAAAAVAAGPGLISVAWRRNLAMIIMAGGTLPPRVARLLRWSHAAGILRRSAGAYEFRHTVLRRYFAGHPASPAPQTSE